MKEVFNLRSALPKYIAKLPKFFNCSKSELALPSCDHKKVSHRLFILLYLTTGQRDQTVRCLNLDYIKIRNEKVILFVPEKLKTNRTGYHLLPLDLKVLSDRELY